MPFTFSHPAVVLPLGRLAKGLSLTGLVIGSMVPDFEYLIRMRMLSRYSHTWQGFIWFDIPLAYILVILYEIFVKDKLITHLPAGINRRFFSLRGFITYYTLKYFLAILISVAIGAATHILWDGFTHPGGMFVKRFAYLSRIVKVHGYRFYIYTLLQHASTAAGALIILISYYMLPRGKLTRATSIAGYWLQIILVMVVVVAIKLATGMPLHQYGTLIVTVVSGGVIGLIVATMLAERVQPMV
ncbi:DUF4184 family protein [Mucilaginibacter xinganensis]|uniref:DUF4184 domain-containing protein n=1 Tax=Mucilaginibacter xinganensis TaxID=1234841 RepID=A0A223P3J0_9SPHI|nr:DUF4184 family protein [Mucilaginibacter xinganensis]ASU36675.1 hypothetical protein MuYL_4792 [Mucilaginibacter xinganensis]